jgi:hypothetical protein
VPAKPAFVPGYKHLEITRKHKKPPVCIGHCTQSIQEIYCLDFKPFISLIPYAHTYFHYVYWHRNPDMENSGITSYESTLSFYPTLWRLSSRILSAIIAINSELVGFPRRLWMV